MRTEWDFELCTGPSLVTPLCRWYQGGFCAEEKNSKRLRQVAETHGGGDHFDVSGLSPQTRCDVIVVSV